MSAEAGLLCRAHEAHAEAHAGHAGVEHSGVGCSGGYMSTLDVNVERVSRMLRLAQTALGKRQASQRAGGNAKECWIKGEQL